MDNKLCNKIVFGKYKILQTIGHGSFGSVYKGKNILTNKLVAIKTEEWKKKGNILESEAYFLYYLKNVGIPELYSFGNYYNYKILVQTLLFDTLDHIFSKRKLNLTIKDVCMIGIQLIDRLEFIHSKHVIHRDIKPENIMIDSETKAIIYLIDFGLAKKYRSGRTGKHIKFTIPERLTGTARYCSVNALRGCEQSRRDDLESTGYTLIYLAQRGYLPWIGLQITDKLERYRKIYHIKKALKEELLCKYLPKEFVDYIKYTKKLTFEQDPDYNYLRSLFLNVLSFHKSINDLKFSWIISRNSKNQNEILDSKKKKLNFFKRKHSLKSRLLKNIETSREREKKLENITKDKLLNILEEKQEKMEKEIIENNKKNNLFETGKKDEKDNNIEINQETPSFLKIQKVDESYEICSQAAHFNMSINIGNSDESSNNDINININDNKSSSISKNLMESINNINNNKTYNIKINDNNMNDEDKKDIVIKTENNYDNKDSYINNEFNFENNSFGEINSINAKNEIDKINKKNINNKEKKRYNIISKTPENNLKTNILDKTNKNKKNILMNERNNVINQKMNMNKGKVINITRNYNKMLENEDNSIIKNNSPKRNILINKSKNKNKINNLHIKQMILNNNSSLKQINLIKNRNDNDYFFNNYNNSYINTNINKLSVNNISSINNNSINKYDFTTNSNSQRRKINYNKMDIKKINSEGKKILKKISNNSLNDTNAKNVNAHINNSGKKNYLVFKNLEDRRIISKSIDINPKNIFSMHPGSIRASNNIRNVKNLKNNLSDKLLKSQKLNKIILSKNKNSRISGMNIPFNLDNFNPKFNNNYINNFNYSINVHGELNNNQNKIINKTPDIQTRNRYKGLKNKNNEYHRLKKIKLDKINNDNIINNAQIKIKNNFILPKNNYFANNINNKSFVDNDYKNKNQNIYRKFEYKSIIK